MSFILGGTGVITDPANAPIDITANTAAPYYATIAYTWNITNLDDYTTYTLSTTNGTIVRSSATLTYTPASAGAGGWTMNGRAINFTILAITNWIARIATGSGRGGGVDSSNNFYATGSSGNYQFTKLNSTGTFQWARQLAVTGATLNASVADANGNQVAAGNSGVNLFSAKYDTTGAIQWQRTVAGLSGTFQGVSIDAAGAAVMVGYGTPIAQQVPYILKYNSGGTLQFQRTLTTAGSGQYAGVVTDASNNIFATGYDGGVANAIIVKYNSTGTIQFQQTLNVALLVCSIAVDSSGNIYAAGVTSSTGYLIKMNSSGVVQWARTQTLQQNTGRGGLVLDSSANVYVFGTNNSNDFQIFKYNTSGVIQWQRSLGTAGSEAAFNGIALDSTGANIYVNGQWPGGFYLSAVLPSDGSKTGTYTVAGTTVTYAATASTDASASVTASTSTYVDAAGTGTDAASAFVDSALTLTVSLTAI